MTATVFEREARAGDEVDDGARHEDLSGLRDGLDALGDVHGKASDVVTVECNLAGMQPDPYFETE